jgi:hypothetical protein
MIISRKEKNGTYCLKELTAEDLEMIEESLCNTFNQSRREEHREFRRNILRIVTPITYALNKIYNH